MTGWPSEQLSFDLPAPPAGADEPLVPARIINEWVYCPPLAFLEWAHGEWADSADTTAGRRDHAASDKGRVAPLPAPGDVAAVETRKRRISSAARRCG